MPRPDASPVAHRAIDLRSPAPVGRPVGGLELSHLGRYAVIGMVLAGCLMFTAWTRIDLRGTAVAMDEAERALASAQAENARLELELATLSDPARLRTQAEELGLSSNITVVDLSEGTAP